VRNAQLDKEASELRAENDTLLRSVEEQKHSAVASAQVGGRAVAGGNWPGLARHQGSCSSLLWPFLTPLISMVCEVSCNALP